MAAGFVTCRPQKLPYVSVLHPKACVFCLKLLFPCHCSSFFLGLFLLFDMFADLCEGLTKEETTDYVTLVLRLEAELRSIIEETAIHAISGYSNGAPRIINSVMTNALLLGAQLQKKTIDSKLCWRRPTISSWDNALKRRIHDMIREIHIEDIGGN